MEVSYFKQGITQVKPSFNCSILDVLKQIKNGKWKELIELLRKAPADKKDEIKKNLPYFTASGVFDVRKDIGLVKHSGLIQIDFDKVIPKTLPADVPPADQQMRDYFDTMFYELSQDDMIFALFVSPSGTGLKAICKVEANPNDQEKNFRELRGYFWGRYHLTADPKVRALSMPCFVSYDTCLHINPHSQAWNL
ncbi:MAG: hypothetical protein MUC49_14830 [Raineya sp.]|jgi:hypothetical protein|nr:hypothetical protein [Raineya sp.]